VHRYQEITRCSKLYLPTHHHHSPPNIDVTAPPRLSFIPSLETITLGFIYHGLLRVFWRACEFATPSLKWQHVQKTGNTYTIFIEQSKTDPFRCGHSITIYASGTLTCPVKALQLYSKAVPSIKFCRALNSTTLATVFEVVQQPPLLQYACQIGSLQPLADETAMLTSNTYVHPKEFRISSSTISSCQYTQWGRSNN